MIDDNLNMQQIENEFFKSFNVQIEQKNSRIKSLEKDNIKLSKQYSKIRKAHEKIKNNLFKIINKD